MRIGCFFFPHFAIQVERKDNSAMPGKPVIVGGFPEERKPVYDASDEAIKCGIKPGMPLRQAYSLCPQGQFLPLAEGKYALVFQAIIDLLASFCPMVEAASLGCAFIEVSQQQNDTRSIREIVEAIERQSQFKPSVGVASSKFAAWAASQVAEPGRCIILPCGEEGDFLQDLPLNLLPGSTEILRQFRLLGIDTIGQVANLPPEAITLEFGNEGKRLWELANGIDSSRLIPWHRSRVLEEKLNFEPPAESLDQLLAGADRLLNRLTSQLWGQCCSRLTVCLHFANGNFIQKMLYLKQPTSSEEVILSRLRHWLMEAKLAGVVTEMRLALADLCAARGSQVALLDREVKPKHNISCVIHQLQARYGKGVVKKAELSRSPTRLPEHSFHLSDF